MNPPFGSPSSLALPYLKRNYPKNYTEIYLSFFSRADQFCKGGRIGAITSRTWLNLSKQFVGFRKSLVNTNRLEYVAELGAGILDNAAVETALSITSHSPTANRIATFLDPRRSDNSELSDSFSFKQKP